MVEEEDYDNDDDDVFTVCPLPNTVLSFQNQFCYHLASREFQCYIASL